MNNNLNVAKLYNAVSLPVMMKSVLLTAQSLLSMLAVVDRLEGGSLNGLKWWMETRSNVLHVQLYCTDGKTDAVAFENLTTELAFDGGLPEGITLYEQQEFRATFTVRLPR